MIKQLMRLAYIWAVFMFLLALYRWALNTRQILQGIRRKLED